MQSVKLLPLFVLLAAIGVAGCGRKVDAMVSLGSSNPSNVNAADKVTEADLGLPFYPGSVEDRSGSPSLISDDRDARLVLSFRTTSDDPIKVSDFYKDKITLNPNGSGWSHTLCCGGKFATLTGTLKNGAEAKMVANRTHGRKLTMVELSVKTHKAPGR